MKILYPVIIAFLVGILAAQFWQMSRKQTPPDFEVLTSAENAALGLPFSEAVRVGNTLYVSGAIGVSPGTLELAPGGVKAETRQTMQNIRAVLERYGSSMDQVAKCTVFLRDMAEWPLMNEAYVEAFGDHRPARSAFGANGLALNGAVEIDCIAWVEQPTP